MFLLSRLDLHRRMMRIIALLLVLALSACATVSQPVDETGAIMATLNDAALAHSKQGDYQGAAHDYLQLSELVGDHEKQAYLLQASSALLKGNFIEGASHTLTLLTPKDMTPGLLLQKQLLDARLALAMQHPDQALKLLSIPQRGNIERPLLEEIHLLRATAHERTGHTLESARERTLRQGLLQAGSSAERRANEGLLWQALMGNDPNALRQAMQSAKTVSFRAWLSLALIAKGEFASQEALRQTLARWQAQYPEHQATPGIIDSIRARSAQIHHRPQQIALLLPQSGTLSALSAAFRDAFLMSYFDRADPSYQPTIRFYDIGDNPESVNTRYDQAIDDGAEFVIGPIRKTAIESLIKHHTSFPVTTLVINYLGTDTKTPPNLIQFGLSPEDEIQQIAQRAWLDGHNQALALVPEGSWGDRMIATFERDWQQLGGLLLEVQRYKNQISDFSLPVTSVLNLDASKQRATRLNRRLSIKVKFEPRRRHDADFLYLVATPREARLIRPQLNFHYASDLPVYAASSIYAGLDQPRLNRDMDGIVFCDIPWILSGNQHARQYLKTIARLWPKDFSRYIRIYALGVDAFHLLDNINTLRAYPHERYYGQTGILSLQGSQRIYRQLQWAKFVRGHAKPL